MHPPGRIITGMDAADRDMLTAFYRNVILDPIHPDDPRYVDLYEKSGIIDDDPVTGLVDTIELTPGSSTQLLSGYRGSGKTTQLLRLKRRLEAAGYVVCMVDVEDYLNTAVPVDITDFLVALAGSLDDSISYDHGLPAGGERRGFWTRAVELLGRVHITGLEVGSPLTPVKLKADIKESTEFADRLRQVMAASLSTLVTEVAGFVDESVKALLQAHPDSPGVVFLIDSVEHYRGTSTTEIEVQASIERLFGNHSEKLQFSNLHILYTVPPYLKVRIPSVASYYEPGAELQIVPAVKVRNVDGTDNGPGLEALQRLVEKRGPWQQVVGEDQLRDLLLASGGHLRDLLRIWQQLLRRARRADALPVAQELVQSALDGLSREMLPVADTDALRLWRIHLEHDSPLDDLAGLPSFARLLDTHLVLCYRNGKEWYDVHPLIEKDIETQVERIGRRSSS